MTAFRALVISEDDASREILSGLLQLNGFRVQLVADGKAALECATTSVPDIILHDLLIADMPCPELARQLRVACKSNHLPLVAFDRSIFRATPPHDLASLSGFTEVILCPEDPDHLAARVQSILQSSQSTNQPIKVGSQREQAAEPFAIDQQSSAFEEHRFRSYVEHIDAIVWEAVLVPEEETLRFTFINHQAVGKLGFPLSSWMTESDFFVTHAPVEDREFMRVLWGGLGKEPADRAFEHRLIADDGRVVEFRTQVKVVKDPVSVSVRVCGLMLDITEHKQIGASLLHSQKMEAIGRFAGGIAHDFNNMLAVILTYSGFVADQMRDNPGVLEDVKEIRLAAERAASLTKQLLTVSRKEITQAGVLYLNSVINESEQLLRRSIGPNIDLQVSLASDLWPVMGDHSKIQQVLLGLVMNSSDAMPEGGKLSIETRNLQLDDFQAELYPGCVSGRYACVIVSDTGCGMCDHVKAHAFEPF